MLASKNILKLVFYNFYYDDFYVLFLQSSYNSKTNGVRKILFSDLDSAVEWRSPPNSLTYPKINYFFLLINVFFNADFCIEKYID